MPARILAAAAAPFAPWLAIVFSALTALGGLYAYSAHFESRLSIVETRQADEVRRSEHIESQVDRLVEWALGHK